MTQFQNSITLAKVQDGADGNSGDAYILQVNQNSIGKFISQKEPFITYETSPSDLIFRIMDNTYSDSPSIIALENIKQEEIELYFITENGNYYTTQNNIEEYNPNTGETHLQGKQIERINLFPILIKYIETNKTTNSIIFHLEDFINSKDLNNDELSFQNCLRLETGSFKIIVPFILEGIKERSSGFVMYTYGNSEDLAKFSINATDITQSVGNTSLSFSKDGLLINNGHLVIQDDMKNAAIYMDNGNITFSGALRGATGDFSGTVYATDGEFRGTIRAARGDIGGFIIEKDKLVSSDINNNLKLYGNGSIEAEDITLGKSAKIKEYLQLGRAFLRNPDINSDITNPLKDIVLNVENNIILKQDGSLKIGNFIFDGEKSNIHDINYNWQIKENGNAIFKEIEAQNAKISNSVLEINRVQTAGGAMVFREGSRVIYISEDRKTIQLEEGEEEIKLESGDYIYLTCGSVKQEFYIVSYQKQDGFIQYNLNKEVPSVFKPNKTILLRVLSGDKDFIFSINSGNADSSMPFLHGHALTLTTCEKDKNENIEDKLNFKKVLVLGDLSGINNDENIGGIGLYSENVFLTGSLTTKISDTETMNNLDNNESYAGISTMNHYNATIFAENASSIAGATGQNEKELQPDNSRIVFWAGAKNTKEGSIQNAPFQVTQDGSLFASQGLFKGAIITEGIIEASELRAAKIHGYNVSKNSNERGPAELGIYDAAKGITFYKTDFDSYRNESKPEKIISFIKNENKDAYIGIVLDKDNSLEIKRMDHLFFKYQVEVDSVPTYTEFIVRDLIESEKDLTCFLLYPIPVLTEQEIKGNRKNLEDYSPTVIRMYGETIEKELFSIGMDGLKLPEEINGVIQKKPFIDIDSDNSIVNYYGKQVSVSDKDSEGKGSNGIDFNSKGLFWYHKNKDQEEIGSTLILDKNKSKWEVNNKTNIKLGLFNIDLNSDNTSIYNSMTLKLSDTEKALFKPQSVGYDLYIM